MPLYDFRENAAPVSIRPDRVQHIEKFGAEREYVGSIEHSEKKARPIAIRRSLAGLAQRPAKVLRFNVLPIDELSQVLKFGAVIRDKVHFIEKAIRPSPLENPSSAPWNVDAEIPNYLRKHCRKPLAPCFIERTLASVNKQPRLCPPSFDPASFESPSAPAAPFFDPQS
jgi:hypothetical protein